MILTLDSETNKKVVSNLVLEGMTHTKEQQQSLLGAINNKEENNNELIRQIAYYGKINNN